MKVRMKTFSANPSGVAAPGQVVPVTPDRARELVSGGYAEYVEVPREPEPQASEPETATVAAPEQAVRVRAKKARRK